MINKHIVENTTDISIFWKDLAENSSCNKITIDWVRHAESCANFSSNNFVDKNLNPNRPTGYDQFYQKDLTKENASIFDNVSRLGFTALTAAFKYHPNLSYIGAQHAILLGTEFIHTRRSNEKIYDMIYVSPSLRTIMTALFALRGSKYNTKIIVVPYILEHLNIAGRYDYVNSPLHSSKLEKYVEMVKEWLKRNWINNFDDIEVMKLLKIIEFNAENTPLNNIIIKRIHGLFNCARNKNSNDKRCDISIIKQINEICFLTIRDIIIEFNKSKNTINVECNNFDKINKTVLEANITNPVDFSNFFDNFYEKVNLKEMFHASANIVLFRNILEAVNQLRLLVDHSVIMGPEVNFEIIKQYEGSDDFTQIDMSKFYQKILIPNLMENSLKIKEKVNILCVVHGTTMRSFFHSKYPDGGIPSPNLRNTQVYEEVIIFDRSAGKIHEKINYEKYLPDLIRTKYQNFEKLNSNICSLDSLQGALYYVVDKNQKMKKYTDDIAFINNESINSNPNYYEKYIKYKKKYLNLKKERDNL